MSARRRMACGNDPTVQLTPGDRQVLDEFAALLTASAEQPALFGAEPAVTRSAVISDCGRYRYRLTREWGPGPTATFCMLNPSTADAEQDDATVRRCVGFARSWGCGGLAVVNLYALRSTDPTALWAAADPIGPDNDRHLTAAAAGTDGPLVAAWGVNARPDRIAAVCAIPGMARLQALAVTKTGQPRHPLYLPSVLTPKPWRQP